MYLICLSLLSILNRLQRLLRRSLLLQLRQFSLLLLLRQRRNLLCRFRKLVVAAISTPQSAPDLPLHF